MRWKIFVPVSFLSIWNSNFEPQIHHTTSYHQHCYRWVALFEMFEAIINTRTSDLWLNWSSSNYGQIAASAILRSSGCQIRRMWWMLSNPDWSSDRIAWYCNLCRENISFPKVPYNTEQHNREEEQTVAFSLHLKNTLIFILISSFFLGQAFT